jgi:hypothetical protein
VIQSFPIRTILIMNRYVALGVLVILWMPMSGNGKCFCHNLSKKRLTQIVAILLKQKEILLEQLKNVQHTVDEEHHFHLLEKAVNNLLDNEKV